MFIIFLRMSSCRDPRKVSNGMQFLFLCYCNVLQAHAPIEIVYAIRAKVTVAKMDQKIVVSTPICM